MSLRTYYSNSNEEDSPKLKSPMPWIGIYVAAASLALCLAMAADTFNGFRSKRLWFPSKFSALNAVSLTFLAIAMKMPLDLSTPMPTSTDQLAKLTSTAFMSIVMSKFIPSLGPMDGNELFTNVTALVVLAITVVGNVCIELGTGLIRHLIVEHALLMFLMLACFVILSSSALIVPSTKKHLDLKCKSRKPPKFTVDELTTYVRNHWMMAVTASPQFVMARAVTCSASEAICFLVALILVEAELRLFFGFPSHGFKGKSDYKWSTIFILLIQTVGVGVGTIAPVVKWYAIKFQHSKKTGKEYGTLFKTEDYWIEKLLEWKKSPLDLPRRGPKFRMLVQGTKNTTLCFCIKVQILIVLVCKLVWHVCFCFISRFVSCCQYCKKSRPNSTSDASNNPTRTKSKPSTSDASNNPTRTKSKPSTSGASNNPTSTKSKPSTSGASNNPTHTKSTNNPTHTKSKPPTSGAPNNPTHTKSKPSTSGAPNNPTHTKSKPSTSGAPNKPTHTKTKPSTSGASNKPTHTKTKPSTSGASNNPTSNTSKPSASGVSNNPTGAKSKPNTNACPCPYALYLEAEEKIPERILENIDDAFHCFIKIGGKNKPKKLMELLQEYTKFERDIEFDSERLPSKNSQEPRDCWAMPVVTLTAIAVAITRNGTDGKKLVRSVREGLLIVNRVENSMDSDGKVMNIRNAAKTVWSEVEFHSKWLAEDLSRIAPTTASRRETLEKLADVARNKVMEFMSAENGDPNQKDPLNWPDEVIAANSMYRISKTILLGNDDSHGQSDEGLFENLAVLIARILSACFTNLPHVITRECFSSPIEKRESSVQHAAQLLGETEEILRTFEELRYPYPGKKTYIDGWRTKIKEKSPLVFLPPKTDTDTSGQRNGQCPARSPTSSSNRGDLENC